MPEEAQEDLDCVTLGMKSLIGSVFMSTNSHKVAAPMCAYLVRNGSRFHFSHEFAYANLAHYLNPMIKDAQLSSDEEGNIILKFCVANYLLRPLQLEDVCLSDFLNE
jgi:hypothetical protein